MEAPVLIYLGMGLVTARIMLDGTSTRGYHGLQWLQMIVNAASIVLLWPLVLFAEKISQWLQPHD